MKLEMELIPDSLRKENIDNFSEKFCFKGEQKYADVLGKGLMFREFSFFKNGKKLQHVCMLMGMIQLRGRNNG